LTNDNEGEPMSQHEADPITEANRELQQLARVSMAGLMHMSDVVARRGARQAGAQRDEQVAIAQAAAANLETDYGSQRAVLATGSEVVANDATLPGGPAQSGMATVTVPVQDAAEPSATPSVDLTSDSGSLAGETGTVGAGLDQDNAMLNAGADSAPAAGPVTLETLLGTAHPMPVQEEVGVAAAAGPSSGLGAAAQAAQQLAVVQGVELSGGTGLG
jgi:hypothetical protein